MKYLSEDHGVNINAATFHYFHPPDAPELLARVFLLEPSEVGRKGGSKRRRNLSSEELRELAVEAGVGERYEHAVETFAHTLSKKRVGSSIRFSGSFDRGQRIVIGLLPGDSSAQEGLRCEFYRNSSGELRFAELAGVPSAHVESLMARHDEESSNGLRGFITGREQIDRLVGLLKDAVDLDSTGAHTSLGSRPLKTRGPD
jgi:hypothetical protein